MNRALTLTLGALLLIGIGDALALWIWYWSAGPTFDGTTAGVWTALAYDFAQGELYRPLLSEAGYGGTRYVPLSFMGHGALIWLGLSPTWAGVLWMHIGVVLMIVGIAWVIRLHGQSWGLAVGVALVTLCTSIYQQYLTEVNTDYIAAALSILALGLFITRAGLFWVTLLCAIAFFMKFTTLYVPAAVFFTLIAQRRFYELLSFCVTGVAMLLIGGFGFQWLSGGDMLANLSAVSSAGTEQSFALWAPYWFAKEIFFYNPAIGVTLLAALIVWARSERRFTDPVALTFLFLLLITVVTFTSKGIGGNHTIAPHAISLIIIGRAIPAMPRIATACFGSLALICALTFLPAISSPRDSLIERANPPVTQIRAVVGKWRKAQGPVFSIHPAHPPELGERAFMLDGFNMEHTFMAFGGEIADDVRARAARQDFSIVILDHIHMFGGIFRDGYEVVDKLGRFVVMVPKQGS